MKLLGIDYGKKRIGIAYSEGLLPSPLSTLEVKTQKQVLTKIQEVCERLAIEKIILGLSGGFLDSEIQKFGEVLAVTTSLPVSYVDETLTSKDAVKKMIEGKTTQKKRKQIEDAVAAAIILNTYLEWEKEKQ